MTTTAKDTVSLRLSAASRERRRRRVTVNGLRESCGEYERFRKVALDLSGSEDGGKQNWRRKCTPGSGKSFGYKIISDIWAFFLTRMAFHQMIFFSFGRKTFSAIGEVLAGQNRGP